MSMWGYSKQIKAMERIMKNPKSTEFEVESARRSLEKAKANLAEEIRAFGQYEQEISAGGEQ